ncbi:hypothetical protein CAEBREN_28051 [Caenorhabditis brenneri]|uniref:glutathione transferase n=1 Tax=Caenorhabditis brenneri TaxID=135651 RepID=G0P9T0_CAEBE|nr:hypothetical protein CAEBREN_28051 [Caenorhabditis brenneri]
MPSYKPTYFDGRGFAEPARMLLHIAGVPFEDVRIPFEELMPGKQSERFLEMKEKTPFGRFPVLSVDGFDIPQSSAIIRYLAKKFRYTGKTPEEQAWADAIVDQFKDYMESFRQFIYAQRGGKSEEEIKKIHDEVFVTAKEKFLEEIERILEKNRSGYLIGDGLTWADLVIADHLYTLGNLKELEVKSLEEYKERIYSLPELRDYIQGRPQKEM